MHCIFDTSNGCSGWIKHTLVEFAIQSHEVVYITFVFFRDADKLFLEFVKAG